MNVSEAVARLGKQLAGGLLAALLLWLAFRNLDWGATARVLGGSGPMCLLFLLPSLLAMITETWARQQTFAAFARAPALLPLLRVRVITEAFGIALPLGPVWSEAAKPLLLSRHCGIDLPTGLTGIAARKYLLLLSQGFYLLLGFAFGHQALTAAMVGLGASGDLALLAPLCVLVLVALAEALAGVLGGGQVAQSMLGLLSSLRIHKLTLALATLADRMRATDGHAVKFFASPRLKRGLLSLQYLGVWLMEACETWVILKLVGVQIDFADAFVVETVVVLARHVLFVLPAGVGIQELGYATLLGGLGVSLEESASLSLLKRMKDLLWCISGYWLFLADGGLRSPATNPIRRLRPSGPAW